MITSHTPDTLRAFTKRWLKNLSPEEQERVLAARKEARKASQRKAAALYAERHPERVQAQREAWEAKNGETRRDYNRKWKAENADRHAATHKAWFETPTKRMRAIVLARIYDSKKRNIPYDAEALHELEKEPATHCAFCGVELDYTAGKGYRRDGPSIDKVVPSKGYIRDNITVLCQFHNTLKGGATAEEHRRLAEFIDGFSK